MTSVEEMKQAVCPHREFDHLDPAQTTISLRSAYWSMQSSDPVAWSDKHGGFWVLTRYDDVKAALSDHVRFTSAGGVIFPALGPGPKALALEMDPPEHTPFRRMYGAWMTPSVLRGYDPMIREVTSRHVRAFAAAGGGDFVSEVSAKLPIEIILRTLGVDADIAHEVYLAGQAMAQGSPEGIHTFRRLCLEQVVLRRKSPRPDFLSSVLEATIGDRPVTDDELAAWLGGALGAGHDTTLLTGAALIHELAEDQQLQARVRSDPSLIPAVVEEVLRLHSPVARFVRTLSEDVTLHGTTMRAGDKVMLVYAAADLDKQVFAEPATLDPSRHGPRHLAFGWGIHRCVGAPLAQRELRILAEVMLTETEFEPAGAAVHGGPRVSGSFLGLEALPLTARLRS